MLQKTIRLASNLAKNLRDLDKVLINQGRILSSNYRNVSFEELQQSEFQIFSQWGEDGIIQYITQNIEIDSKTFVEFGVETFREANCRFLMQKDFWRGLVIDGSAKNIDKIRSDEIYWKHDLKAVEAFISKDNIASIIADANFDKIGILSVDIDGVDYFVLEALGGLSPSIIIVEYNGIFGSEATVSVPYDESFWRNSAHHSNLYYGASIAAFDHLLSGRGYKLVGGNSAGNNAFFVREDLLTDKIRAVPIADAYRRTSFAEGRLVSGDLDFVRGSERRKTIASMPLVDVKSGETLLVSDLPLE